MKPKQLSFLPKLKLQYGGEFSKGKRKEIRPFDPKRPLHVVLRSTKARGIYSMLHPHNKNHIDRYIREISEKWGVRVYRFANVGNHIHMLIQVKARRQLRAFLRESAGTIAMAVTGAKKGYSIGRFWDELLWSRIVNWGRDLKRLDGYFAKNIFEAIGAFGVLQKKAGVKVFTIAQDGSVYGVG